MDIGILSAKLTLPIQ